jgi:hypothetical protein
VWATSRGANPGDDRIFPKPEGLNTPSELWRANRWTAHAIGAGSVFESGEILASVFGSLILSHTADSFGCDFIDYPDLSGCAMGVGIDLQVLLG